ncbi:MAG TPA: TetR family transcriptional regulator C-terminal domain-containing protein [Terriglobia bacterium]|nr:TetR family transcriptional regulator C-terminal domain-containing protein [Terriglobia bacterium]
MSPRRADPELARRRREALIKAGFAEILEKGIQATTLDSVVARAESSKGGALYYFRTKDDLLYAVLEWLLAQLDHTLDQVAQAQQSPRVRLASELEVLFHSTEVNRKLYVVLFDFIALSLRSERFKSLLNAFFKRCRERDVAIMKEGIEQHQFRPVRPEDVALAIRALVDGYCLHWLLSGSQENLEDYRDRCRAVLGAYLLR